MRGLMEIGISTTQGLSRARGVTPAYGTFVFVGMRSQRIYNVDSYIADVADDLIHFDGGGGASPTSPTSFTAPEDILLSDVSFKTGPTVISKLQILRGNQATGDFLRLAAHLDTSPARSPVRLGFVRGTEVRAIEKV
ncbi:unnamed protein product [marine sediment metagenome]|uniref:Uncharacterized protein n=1 Tax=marine sediment metagenome TaxID=412755 RepID=X1LD56_9ZZZZ